MLLLQVASAYLFTTVVSVSSMLLGLLDPQTNKEKLDSDAFEHAAGLKLALSRGAWPDRRQRLIVTSELQAFRRPRFHAAQTFHRGGLLVVLMPSRRAELGLVMLRAK